MTPEKHNKDKEKQQVTSRILSIYGYTDFRNYLKDFYEFRKGSERGYSYRTFSKAAGFSSPNILKLIIDGERNLGHEAIFKFIKALNLTGPMADYFTALVNMNQSKNDEEKQKWFQELTRLIPYAKRRELNAEALKYLSHWLYPVLREMVALPDFRDDPYWISRRLNGKASPSEISSALQFLLSEQYISKKEDGTYAISDHMVISSDEIKSLAIRNYHRQMLELAKEFLEELPIEKREFGALTFLLPESAIEELKFKIKAFRRDLHTWAIQVSQNASDQVVVQTNFQMYPHTKRVNS